jgi:hypothetical protein
MGGHQLFNVQATIRASLHDEARTREGRLDAAAARPQLSSEARGRALANDDVCFNVTMYDSFGDGWDGAEYSVMTRSNGSLVVEGTLSDGSEGTYEGTDEVCVEADVCHLFEVSEGRYPDEISWNVGDGVLTGDGATVEALELFVTPSGELLSHGCPTHAPTGSTAPTVSLAPSTAPTVTFAPTSSAVDTYGRLLSLLQSFATMQVQAASAIFEFEAAITIGSGQYGVITGTAGSSIFDGRGSKRLFVVKDGAELTLRGLVLRNGRATATDEDAGEGGALLILNGAHVKLANCRVTGSVAEKNGGGLALSGGSNVELDDGSSVDANSVLTPPQ